MFLEECQIYLLQLTYFAYVSISMQGPFIMCWWVSSWCYD